MIIETPRILGRKPLNVFHFSISKRVAGLGLWIDFIPPIGVREESFVLHLDLLWIRFYWIKYKETI
jgi:hypothetical protein